MKENGKSTIFILDDHPLIRHGLKSLISLDSELRVCGETGEASSILESIKLLNPDLITMDLSLNYGNGLELIKDIITFNNKISILVISLRDELIYAERALHAGAKGFISKTAASEIIIIGIKMILNGKIYLSQLVKEKIIKKVISGIDNKNGSPIENLSDRELEVFQLIGEGKDKSLIAQNLELTKSTIDTHCAHIKKKLYIDSNTELIKYAISWFIN